MAIAINLGFYILNSIFALCSQMAIGLLAINCCV